MTVHAGPDFSLNRLESDLEETELLMLEAAAPWIGSRVATFQVHRWRYSKPAVLHPEACLILHKPRPMAFSGDAFAGPRVEGAALSGMAAWESLIESPVR